MGRVGGGIICGLDTSCVFCQFWRNVLGRCLVISGIREDGR